jgi:hypothetical protein
MTKSLSVSPDGASFFHKLLCPFLTELMHFYWSDLYVIR